VADGSPTITPAPAPISRAAWTTREIRVLRDAYPGGGINGVIALLPHRSRSAIYQHANALGLRCASRPLVRESWTLEPGMDEAITAAHQRPMQRGDVVALAKRLARPVWWVSRRARDLGLTTPLFREPPWSKKELALLRETRNLRPEAVQRALRRHGFRRTATAIAVQRKRQQVQRDPRDDNYTAHEVAGLLGADPSTVARWIRMGLLAADHDPTHKPTPDGRAPYRVTNKALRDFIITHPIHLDLRKLPTAHTPWFVDLLAGSKAGESNHG
jgi:hypothetical protein